MNSTTKSNYLRNHLINKTSFNAHTHAATWPSLHQLLYSTQTSYSILSCIQRMGCDKRHFQSTNDDAKEAYKSSLVYHLVAEWRTLLFFFFFCDVRSLSMYYRSTQIIYFAVDVRTASGQIVSFISVFEQMDSVQSSCWVVEWKSKDFFVGW